LINAAGNPVVTDTTGALGTYSLSGFGAGPYTITPTKSGGVNGSISAFDSGRIAQYVTANILDLTFAQKFVADVTGDGSISSFDAALIARYVAGLSSLTGSTGNWVFDPASNFHASVTTDIMGEDYSALLMGDVTGNWGDPSPYRPAMRGGGPERSAVVTAPRLLASSDNEVVVPIAVQGAADKGIIACELDLRYDPAVLQPRTSPVELARTANDGFSIVANAKEPGLLRIVVYGARPLSRDGVLLNLKFTAVGAPGTVSPLTWERIMFNEGSPRSIANDGSVEISAANANQAEISGRLLTAMGQGISNASVTLTDSIGRSRSAVSNGFGFYRFSGLQPGQTYTIAVASRRWTFAPLTVSVTGQMQTVDMIAGQ
jgi:hypothetical protein